MFGRRRDARIERRNLMEEVDVSHGVLNVRGEVCDLSAAVRPGQMVVNPSDENLLRREFHEFFQGFALHQQCSQTGMVVQIYVCQESVLCDRNRPINYAMHSL